MSSDAKNMISQSENDARIKTSKSRACINHFKRFWWIHLLVAVILIVLIACLIVFVVLPKVVQSKLDAAKLDIQGVAVLQTKANGYLMEINSTITTDGSVHADVEGFKGTLTLADVPDAKPFATLDFPPTTAESLSTVNISQPVQITDAAAFIQFNTLFYQGKSIRVRLHGNTKVKPRGTAREVDVDFTKFLEFNGLERFQGTKVDGTVDIAARPGTPNFRGTAEIPNNSHFTLEIGNATFTNFADDQDLGKLTINNLILYPGINKVDIEAELDQLKVLSIIRKRPYCETGIVPFKLLSTDVVNHGEKLEYFVAALGSANQTVDMDIGRVLSKAVDGFKLSCSRG
ncbi:hypothetical protein XA68_11871 [Ophiocordyceps unilateralis]|uniref:Uncharacterized protein n=1 Tax=Ophiocordyceps unilateralis TaxID=268505 RepID=A0A2A9PFV2_OPHUN|nr:hypothetical protein XA68_11871 [Ophiocordyceps unilateralis]